MKNGKKAVALRYPENAPAVMASLSRIEPDAACVGCEVRASCATSEDSDLALFHHLYSLPLAVLFTDREHVDSSQHASLLSDAGESGTQCQSIDCSGKHTHLVAFYTVEALACTT